MNRVCSCCVEVSKTIGDLKPNDCTGVNLSSLSSSISLTWPERQCDPVFEPARDFKTHLTFSSHNLPLFLDRLCEDKAIGYFSDDENNIHIC